MNATFTKTELIEKHFKRIEFHLRKNASIITSMYDYLGCYEILHRVH